MKIESENLVTAKVIKLIKFLESKQNLMKSNQSMSTPSIPGDMRIGEIEEIKRDGDCYDVVISIRNSAGPYYEGDLAKVARKIMSIIF